MSELQMVIVGVSLLAMGYVAGMFVEVGRQVRYLERLLEKRRRE